MSDEDRRIKSYIVQRDGIEGKREHWVPGNVKRGTGPREKHPYDTEEEALATGRGRAYLCPHCNKWHVTSDRWGSP